MDYSKIINVEHDLQDITFESFVTFLFDHPVANRSNDEKPWYYDVELTFDPSHILHLYIQLFHEPSFLLKKYNQMELEQGFWAAQSCVLTCSVSELVWHSDVELELREECIRSMYVLYEKFFSEDPLETSSNMWWDSLAYGYCCGNYFRERSEEERKMQDVMFETLCKILSLESKDCQFAALHGVGHLRHPNTEVAINSYLSTHPELENEAREYALAAIKGEIL